MLICAKCETHLPTHERAPAQEPIINENQAKLPGLRLDTYRMQSTLGRIDRLVQRFEEPAQFDEIPARQISERTRREVYESSESREIQPENSFPWLASLSLAGGVMLLVCGCFLISWSVAAKRPELFNIGFPIAVISLACMALAACLFFQDASGKQAETQKWLADVQNQLGGIREITRGGPGSLGSIPELPSTAVGTPVGDRLSQSDERLRDVQRRLSETRNLS